MAAQGQAPATGDTAENNGTNGTNGTGPDYGSQIESLLSGQNEMREFLQAQPWQQQEAEPEPEQDFGLDFDGIDESDPRAVQQYIDGRAQRIAEQMFKDRMGEQLKPLQDSITQMQTESAAQQLVNEFPRLGEPEIAEQTVKMAGEFANLMGHPELANNPQLWKLAYLAQESVAEHNRESSSDSPDAVTLEGSGGAMPSGQLGESDLVQRIMEPEHRGSGVLSDFFRR